MSPKVLVITFCLLLSNAAFGEQLTLKNECHCNGAAFYCNLSLEGDQGTMYRVPAEIRLDRGSADQCYDYLVRTMQFDGLHFDLDDTQIQRDSWEMLAGLDRAHFCYAAGGSNMACDLDLTAFLLINPEQGIKANEVTKYDAIYVAGIDPGLSGAADLAAYAALGSKTGLYGTIALSRRTMTFKKVPQQ